VIEQTFLKFSAEKLAQLRDRIHDCVGRLSDDQIWMRQTQNENSIGNLVLHLAGNVRQWIGHGVGGRVDDRQRDTEFAARGGLDKAALLARLDDSVNGAVAIIAAVTPDQMTRQVVIQKYTVTIMEAIYHVIEHFAGHTGQILFATKLLTGEDLGYYRHLSQPSHNEATP
jgi:uncharacterized damage-inducible protein DinB